MSQTQRNATSSPAEQFEQLEAIAAKIKGSVSFVPLGDDGQPNFKPQIEQLFYTSTGDVDRAVIYKKGFYPYTLVERDGEAAFITRFDFETGKYSYYQVAGNPESEDRCIAAIKRGLERNGDMSLCYSDPVNDNRKPGDPPPTPSMCEDPLSPEAAGGLLADIAEWITETAIVPVPELSMVSAIALLAGMFGGRLLGPTQSGLNVYATTFMDTAGGKGHPPKAIRTLAELGGKSGAVTNGDHTSYAALERTLRRNSSTVMTMDEFGITLQDISGRHASAPAASIRKFLLAVYDQANAIFDGRIYASSETKKTNDDTRNPVRGPFGSLDQRWISQPLCLYRWICTDLHSAAEAVS